MDDDNNSLPQLQNHDGDDEDDGEDEDDDVDEQVLAQSSNNSMNQNNTLKYSRMNGTSNGIGISGGNSIATNGIFGGMSGNLTIDKPCISRNEKLSRRKHHHRDIDFFLDSASRSSCEQQEQQEPHSQRQHSKQQQHQQQNQTQQPNPTVIQSRQRFRTKSFRYSPDTTDCDSNCGDLDTNKNLLNHVLIQAPDGDAQPSTEVDLFISTEKIMVLNTDLKEIMMDHALRTISYIADIGDLVVLMARRRFVPQDIDEAPKQNRTPKMICHVFESDEAQFIAQSIGQAFQVAYMEFLKANGIEDHSFVKEMDYQEVLNSQEIFGDELEIFAKKELQKEVVVPKAKGEILGVVIVESGWGSMLPTVVIANLMSSGAAARCGQLNIGDQLIAINGLSLVGLPLSTCQSYIKNTKTQTVVKFTVVPCAPVVEVKIKRPNTKYQLGFSVQNGVICSLLRGGIAERGGVRVGHRIIEINNQSVVAVPHEKIVNLLATSVGEFYTIIVQHSIYSTITGLSGEFNGTGVPSNGGTITKVSNHVINFTKHANHMPCLEDGLSSGHTSDADNNNPGPLPPIGISMLMDMKRSISSAGAATTVISSATNDYNTDSSRKSISPLTEEINTIHSKREILGQSPSELVNNKVFKNIDPDLDSLYSINVFHRPDVAQQTPPPPAPAPHRKPTSNEPLIKDLRPNPTQRMKPLVPTATIWIPRDDESTKSLLPHETATTKDMAVDDEDDIDTDLETDRLLGHQRLDDQGFFDDKKTSSAWDRKSRSILTTSLSKFSPKVQQTNNTTQASLIRQGLGNLLTDNSNQHSQPTTNSNSSNSNNNNTSTAVVSSKLVDIGDSNSSPERSDKSTGKSREVQNNAGDSPDGSRSSGLNKKETSSTTGSNSISGEKKIKKSGAVLIEGVLFRARYLGSTQLICEGQPTKSTRMMQAEEAVSKLR
uniref:Protein lin-10 n=1 Tax=Megaselia scalaris TaxID=36166 RepID=T1GDA9_MEGSC